MTELDINQIQKLIPQRYPFLMIDRVLEIQPWKKLKAIKNLTINEPYFVGHFPEKAIMPGVLIIEAIAQATSVLYKYENKVTSFTNYEIVLGSVKSRFNYPAYPGDQMIIEINPEKFISTGGIVKGVSRVGDKTICKCNISFSTQEIAKL